MKHIKTEIKGAIARVYLNRPEVLNALNGEMVNELFLFFNEIMSNLDVKVIIVSGEGRAFCAGVDLKATTAEGFHSASVFMETGLKLAELMQAMPQVVIAQIHGYCFTGALEFMLFFDLVYCDRETQFGDTHSKWSILPRWGLTQRLSRKVGLEKAKELSFRAMRVKGTEAEKIGLVNQAFEVDLLDDEVNQIANDILQNSFEAIAKIKQLYNEGHQTTLKEGLRIEYEMDPKLNSTEEYLSKFKK